MKKYLVVIAIISVMMALSGASAFAQDSQVTAEEDMASVQDPQVDPALAAGKTNELAIYGEVQAVNVPGASISVQYYDYDSDEERTLEVSLDKDSKMENVKVIDEVKPGDWVDVTYTVTGGKNTAKMVSVEVEELAAEDSAPIDTTDE